MVHLSQVGCDYEYTVNSLGQTVLRASGNVVHPTRTMCGIRLASFSEHGWEGDVGAARYIRTMADHASPLTCRECLRNLPHRKSAHVQPVLLP